MTAPSADPAAVRAAGRPARPAAVAEAPTPAVAEQRAPVVDDGRAPVLITGAGGLVGTHLCRELTGRGTPVRAFVRDPVRAAGRLAPYPVDLRVGDVRDADALGGALRGVSAVVHLAATLDERAGDTYEATNVHGTDRVLAAARAAGVARVIYLSSNSASEEARSGFLRSKRAAERLVTASDRRWTVLRPSVIFGHEDRFTNSLARLVRLTPIIPLPNGGAAHVQPVSANDVARVIAAALERDDTVGRVYALGGPKPLPLWEVVERVLLAMDARRLLVGVRARTLRPIVALTERLFTNPPLTVSFHELLTADDIVEGNALRDTFGIVASPFAPEELLYLRRITTRAALRSLTRRW